MDSLAILIHHLFRENLLKKQSTHHKPVNPVGELSLVKTGLLSAVFNDLIFEKTCFGFGFVIIAGKTPKQALLWHLS
jgi:hypothetical protein